MFRTSASTAKRRLRSSSSCTCNASTKLRISLEQWLLAPRARLDIFFSLRLSKPLRLDAMKKNGGWRFVSLCDVAAD
jgi:hypothetical protein